MTTPRGPIVFNNSTGSDTAASGLGPGTAVSGSAAAHTGGSASTTITLTNSPDLSGLQAGDLLWLKTSSGRQFSVIASADNGAKTVTVDDSFNIASGSAVDYAIGGKRATLNNTDSRKLFEADWKEAWSAEAEYTGTNYTLSSTGLALYEVSNKVFVLRGTGGLVVIEQTSNAPCFTYGGTSSPHYWQLENLQLINSNGTKTSAIGVHKGGGSTGGLIAINCNFGHASNQLLHGVKWDDSNSGGVLLFGCTIHDCTSIGFRDTGQGSNKIIGCSIHDNGDAGIYIFGNTSCQLQDNLIYGNTGDGIFLEPSGGVSLGAVISGNTIDGNGGHGLYLKDVDTGRLCPIIFNNILTTNGAYGVNSNSALTWQLEFCDYNVFGSGSAANTSGARNNIPTGDNDLSLDPQYVGSGDYTPTNTTLEGAAFPSSFP